MRTRSNKQEDFAAGCDIPGVIVCKTVAVNRHYGRKKWMVSGGEVRTAQDRHRKAALRFCFRPKPALDCLEPQQGFRPDRVRKSISVLSSDSPARGVSARALHIVGTSTRPGPLRIRWERPPKVQS